VASIRPLESPVAPGVIVAKVVFPGRAAAGGASEIVTTAVTRVVFTATTTSVTGIIATLRPATT
jgi:hypothetical protein